MRAAIKLYIPNIINTQMKLHSIAIWADKKLTGFWQISLYIKNKKNNTGCLKSIRTVGVASKPVEPRPLSFAGFFIYVK